MKRLAIFAHFDKHKLIDDYVILYLEKLKEVVDDIIFVSDGNIEEKELQKINHLILDSICQRHEEYDFGSYKRGFFLLKDKYEQKFNDLDELVFANDSCYCVGDFTETFKKIENNKTTDVFGLTDNNEKSYHLQSYFLVFRKTIFHQDFFERFFKNIKKLDNKKDIIFQYEIGLSEIIKQNNKTLQALFSYEFLHNHIEENEVEIKKIISQTLGTYKYFFGVNKTYNKLLKITLDKGFCYNDGFLTLLQNQYPLLKCRLISGFFYSKKRPATILSYFWKSIVKKTTNFNSNLIVNHSGRCFKKIKNPKSFKYHALKAFWFEALFLLVLVSLLINFYK